MRSSLRKWMKNSKNALMSILIWTLTLTLTLCFTTSFAESAEVETKTAAEKIYAEIVVENYGDIILELDPETAPLTVANFIELADNHFYDGLTFHRIIYGFMIQGGDPNGNGTGGSDKNIVGEFAANGIPNELSHTRGVISMARAYDPNSASSQFFIMHQDALYLDGQYAAFGKVISGMDVVDAICISVPVTDNNGSVSRENQPVITSVRIISAEEAAELVGAAEQN